MNATAADPFSCASIGALVRHPAARVEHVAAWIARDAHPRLVPGRITEHLDNIADHPELDAPLAGDAHEQAALLVHHLAIRLHFSGNSENYHDPENSYLDSVLRRRKGIPISLAAIYIALAERLGISASPIGFPGNLLVRIGDGETDGVLVDPFAGCIVHERDLPDILKRTAGSEKTVKPEHLRPLNLSQFAQRMLMNLKLLHHAHRDYGQAYLVTDRLVELTASPELRRDRGLYALQLDAHRTAARDLAHYLLKRPTARDAKTVRQALQRSRNSAPHPN